MRTKKELRELMFSVPPPTECGWFDHDGMEIMVCVCGDVPVYQLTPPMATHSRPWWELPKTWDERTH